MDIIEGNRIIAGWMGLDTVTIKTAQHPNGFPHAMDEGHGGYKPLQYHTSWDWLMPVIAKIKDNAEDFKSRRFRSKYGGEAEDLLDRIDLTLSYIEIKDVHEAVTNFIQWYNTNLTTPTP